MNTADLPAIVNPDTLWDVDAVARYVLRRAMGRAGLVRGYLQVCRRKGCGHEEQAEDSELRHCPDCKMKLWPKALPRHLRFHDLRGTTARCSPAPAFRWSSRSGCCAMRTRGSPRTSTRAWSWGIFAPASRDCRRLDPRSLDF